ncbi:MAG: hypothetical protein ABJA35_01900 [Parafilimonas sp.]
MKKLFIACGIAIAIYLIPFFVFDIYSGNTAIDIHLHDTYFVISHWSFVIMSAVVLLFLFSLVSSILNKFHTNLFNWLLAISVVALIFFFMHYKL